MRNNIFLALIISFSFPGMASAQADLQDTSFQQASINSAIDLYYKNIGENAHIYNGGEYMMTSLYQREETKNLFFLSIFSQNGSVIYDGTLYQDVPLSYDLLHDELITNRYKQNFKIRLNADKVDGFTLAGHEFIRLSDDSAHRIPDGTGYYEMKYRGKSAVIIKRRKKMEEKLTGIEAIVSYNPDDHFFILRNGFYVPVRTKKSVLNVFKDKKKELRKYLRKNKISFSPYPEFGIAKAAAYYDQIKN
jgi:hypothetical protein